MLRIVGIRRCGRIVSFNYYLDGNELISGYAKLDADNGAKVTSSGDDEYLSLALGRMREIIRSGQGLPYETVAVI